MKTNVMDATEREFVGLIQRYCKSVRKATTNPAVAGQAAVWEGWLEECLSSGNAPLGREAYGK